MKLAQFAERLGEITKDAIAAAVAPLATRLADLEAALKTMPAGQKGDPGANGKDGRDGIDGKDGRDGIDGQDGRDGVAGKDGPAGPRGEKGEPGRDGVDGKAGEPGPRGEKGDPGVDGKDGRDGIEIVPLDGIDPSRSYRRGTWAAARGGLFRAVRDTDPVGEADMIVCGWQVIVDGVAAVVVAQSEDPRVVVVSSVLASGKTVAFDFQVPAMIYRGIYRETEQYAKGDTVTFGGSLWHRSDPAGSGKPGIEGSGWTLCAKRGRDGAAK